MGHNNFDLLRFFAAMQVLLMHANAHIMSDFGYSLTGFWAIVQAVALYALLWGVLSFMTATDGLLVEVKN